VTRPGVVSRSVGLVLGLCLVPVAAGAGDWPQFRGPARDGVSAETGLAPSWPEAGPPVVFRVPLGNGFSGVSIAGGRAFTLFSAGRDEVAIALDASTGKELWRRKVDAAFTDSQGSGPRSTPTVHGGRVHALSAQGKLVALDAGTGEVVWQRDLRADFEARLPEWGVSTSPLVEGEHLVVDVGGADGASIVAFDEATGKEAWRSGDDRPGYSSPIAFTAAGVRQIVAFTGTRIASLAPSDGKLLWSATWRTAYEVNAATPVFVPPDRLFVSSGYDHGATLFRLVKGDGGGIVAETVWETRSMKNQFSSSVLHDGHLYGFDDKTLRCIAVDGAETRWRAKGYGHGSLLVADGRLIVLADDGTLALVRATPEAHVAISAFRPLAGKTWAAPSLANGTLYVRDGRELVAFDVSE
jgi:outer membrane protein assembly factor BamB